MTCLIGTVFSGQILQQGEQGFVVPQRDLWSSCDSDPSDTRLHASSSCPRDYHHYDSQQIIASLTTE
ncbi:MAG: hypothetical protein V1754_15610 [Pseudomonadota bacterium]